MAKQQSRNFQQCLNEIREAAVGIAFNSYAYYGNAGDGEAELAKITEANKVITKALRDIAKID